MSSVLTFETDAYAHHARLLLERRHQDIIDADPTLNIPPIFSSSVQAEVPSTVGILGAGPGGLYTALILDDLKIPYHIIEAQDHVGGRLFTYQFPNPLGAPYNYFDVGAMRFPKIPSMARVFHLFNYPPLNHKTDPLAKRLTPFYFKNDNAFFSYNDVTIRQKPVPPKDPFKSSETIKDTDPTPYLTAGHSAIVDDVIADFATRLLDDLKSGTSKGWEYMMKFDFHSTRSYMQIAYRPSPSLNLPATALPTDVVNWLETFDKSTGWYDRALSETVLEAIAFGWRPGPNVPETSWFCIDGGSQRIADSMANYIKSKGQNPITFKERVTAIGLSRDRQKVEVITNNANKHTFSHVISTLPLPVLRTVDLKKAELTTMQSNALRQLNYGPSVKIGMQFKTAWWKTAKDRNGKSLNIVGGQSYTDRPLRTIVYPSFGDVAAGKTTTLIASYCWTEDASRLGALIDNDQAFLETLVLRELADIHSLDQQFLKDQLLDTKGWSWSHDPFTMGAFAFFGPGKFGSLYASLNAPAANYRLHFAGEALSARHAWVEGALDSAWRAVSEMLMFPGFEKYRDQFRRNWGTNPEWITTSCLLQKETPDIFNVEDSLLYKNIAFYGAPDA